MNRDIDAVLKGWPYKPDVVQARLVQAGDGRQIIQMRVELGVLQLETAGRPDGTRPHGQSTYFDYLRAEAGEATARGEAFVLNEEQCQDADREFMQFYHRRVCWLALRNYARAVADADHTLGFMDLVRDHSPTDEYRVAHEQYRGFVLFHRTQAAAAREVERDRPESAVNAIRDGLERLRAFFATHDLEEQMEEDGMVKQLRRMEAALRETHQIEKTLEEQFQEAIAAEDYERAAELRDLLRRQKSGGA